MENESELKESTREELIEMFQDTVENPFTVMSFSDLDTVDKSEDVVENLGVLHYVAQSMIANIIGYSPDKVKDARRLLDEYYEMANVLLDESEMKEVDEAKSGLLDKIKGIVNNFKSKIGKRRKDGHYPKEAEDTNKELGMMVWKGDDGRYRWFARYSNNFRDNDNPPEIITKSSHERFVELVDTKQTDYPELWHWHIPGTSWGKADWVAFDTDNGIAMASGYVYEDHEKEAEELAGYEEPIAVSHGMPIASIKRDSADETIIVEHITKEISDLPLWAAANKLTSFEVVKENEMGIPNKKKEYLKSLGMSDEQISAIEIGNANTAKEATDAGIESKENDEAVTEEIVEPVEHVMESDQAESKETPDGYVTPAVLNEVVKQVTEAVVEVLKGVRDEVSALRADVDEIKEAKTKEVPMDIPTASISAMIASKFSAIGRKETQIKESSTLLKGSPDETPSQENSNIVNTGNPVIDGVLSGILGR